MKKYTLGIDFGTLSARAVILDTESGYEAAEAVCEYPHGVMDKALPSGKPLPKDTALQHPADYIEALKSVTSEALSSAGISGSDVAAVAIDFTSCTILPIYADGTPLCADEKYADEMHAYVKLWKHHGAQKEADAITALAKKRGDAWVDIYGGKISSEFFLPKIMQILNEAPEIYDEADHFIEAGDWLSFILTGKMTRSVSFAGYKANWVFSEGYPSSDFLRELDARLGNLFDGKLDREITPITEDAGVLNEYGAELLGLDAGTPLSLPIIDAQAGIPALNSVREGEAVLILGTSGCLIWHEKKRLDIPGILGHCYAPIAPELYTYEAGQACLGDGFDWFVKTCVPKSYYDQAEELGIGIHKYLREKAKKLAIGESGIVALDWFNGNRSLLNDAELSGMILGITITTRPEEIYRALIEASAFSTKMIIDEAEAYGSRIKKLCLSGGIALKDEMMMQIFADVLGRDMLISSAKQSGAYGSAVRATVSAKICKDIFEAAGRFEKPIAKTYTPIAENIALYQKLYEEYKALHDYFGKGGNEVMKRLKKISKG
jgi:L-ribulokinase